jgi:PIN domain nuclease of toxin-antitoxin system
MLAGLADTHTAIWYLYGDKRLSAHAKSFIDSTYFGDGQIGFSSISLAEIIYLEEKGKILPHTLSQFLATVDMQDGPFIEVPFDRNIIKYLLQVPRTSVPDLPDRIIAATALYLGVPLITRDAQIKASGIDTIW